MKICTLLHGTYYGTDCACRPRLLRFICLIRTERLGLGTSAKLPAKPANAYWLLNNLSDAGRAHKCGSVSGFLLPNRLDEAAEHSVPA